MTTQPTEKKAKPSTNSASGFLNKGEMMKFYIEKLLPKTTWRNRTELMPTMKLEQFLLAGDFSKLSIEGIHEKCIENGFEHSRSMTYRTVNELGIFVGRKHRKLSRGASNEPTSTTR